MPVQRPVRRAAAVSLTSLALSCSGVAVAHADSGQGQGKPPAHSQAGGKKSGHQGGHGGDPGHQGTRGHGGNPGHQGSKGGNQGVAQPGQPAQPAPPAPPAQGSGEGGGQGATPPQSTPGEDVKGPKQNPPGNNGTIKIEQPAADGIPQNNPHPGCQLRVEWYGFDEGDDVVSEVTFDAIAPTAGSSISVAGDTSVPVGGDAASGAGTDTGLDGSELYTLSFTGTPHPQQGYHVKVTVHTPYSLGNDSKTKVFWVEPCDEGSTPTGGTVPPGAPDVPAAPGVPGAPGGVDVTETGTDVTESAGSPTDGSGAVPVPTSVDAGSEGLGDAGDLIPVGLLGLGAVVTAAAAYLRRRATHG